MKGILTEKLFLFFSFLLDSGGEYLIAFFEFFSNYYFKHEI